MRYSAQKLCGNELCNIAVRINTVMEIFGGNSKKLDYYSNLGCVSSFVAGRSQQDSRLPALMCELESRIFGLPNHQYSAIEHVIQVRDTRMAIQQDARIKVVPLKYMFTIDLCR